MSYLDWKVGDKVVFIGTGTVTLHRKGWKKYIPGLRRTVLSHNLVSGEVYEIEAMTTHIEHDLQVPIVVIYLKGFRFNENGKVGFPAVWFRKVQTRKTDISIFTSMLNGAKERERA